MSAIYKLKYRDDRGKWWGVKVLTAEGWQDTLDLVRLDEATPFTSEAEAWTAAAKFKLPPDQTDIF